MNQDQPRLIFYHLPRTAGSSLTRDILFPNFAWWRRCKVNYDERMRNQIRGIDPRSWPPYVRKGIRLLAGHMPFGFGENFPGPSEYFTFVRNPVARAVSDYHFCRSNPANPAYPAANKLSLKEFVEGNYSYVCNGQVRWLSNAAFGARFASGEAMLEAAMRNLEQISFVGLTEQFEHSVERLCARYGLTMPSTPLRRRNVGTPRDNRLSEEELIILQRHNALDQVIYEHCLQRFASEGPGQRPL